VYAAVYRPGECRSFGSCAAGREQGVLRHLLLRELSDVLRFVLPGWVLRGRVLRQLSELLQVSSRR